MKIALINVVGTEGSTGKIVSRLAKIYTGMGYDCRIFHGRGKRIDDGMYVKHGELFDNVLHYGLAKITDKEGYYSTFFTKRILNDLKEFAPQRIIISNLHGHWLNIPFFVNEISKLDVQISWLMADEYPFTARCEYTYGCDKFVKRCEGCTRYKNIDKQYNTKELYYKRIINKTIFSSAEYIVNGAKKSSLLSDASFDVKNTGIDVDFYCPTNTGFLKKKLGIIDDRKILLNVAPFSTKRKGVTYFLDVARKLEKDERFVFINVGFDGDKTILPSNFIGIPYVSNQEELRAYYSLADVYVCTSIADAMPNACLEAMSCGTPLIAFNKSGMPYIADYPVLKLVDETTSDCLLKTVLSIEKKDIKIQEMSRKIAVDKYSFAYFAKSIIEESINN